jgi:hypothetical protein
LLLGQKATAQAVLSCDSPLILYIITHTWTFNKAKDPMMKFGLAFSGANKSIDCILTPQHITAIDLSGTQLVVLSGL